VLYDQTCCCFIYKAGPLAFCLKNIQVMIICTTNKSHADAELPSKKLRKSVQGRRAYR
jgi:hypothetical protein